MLTSFESGIPFASTLKKRFDWTLNHSRYAKFVNFLLGLPPLTQGQGDMIGNLGAIAES
jgi:hypothetical protein